MSLVLLVAVKVLVKDEGESVDSNIALMMTVDSRVVSRFSVPKTCRKDLLKVILEHDV